MYYSLALAAAGLAAAQAPVRLAPEHVDPLITPNGPVKSLPPVGFGTWMLPNDARGADAVARAIKVGFRHIDGATAYQNQDAVGKGIALALKDQPGLKREHLWVTSKLWATRHKDVTGGIDVGNKQLGLDYVDLALIHFPIGNSQRQTKGPDGKTVTELVAEYDSNQMWAKMEAALPGGKIRHIGISNFNVTQLESLLAVAKVRPLVHQIESHPYLQDWKFLELHRKHNIPIVAYAPLGNTNPEYHYRNWKSSGRMMLDDPAIKKIATARGCTPAQVALVWNLNRNITVIPKAFNPIHQVENYEARQKCKLTDADMLAIKALDQDGKAGRRYWDMCCTLHLPCYYGLQDQAASGPVSADYCTQKWASQAYNKERTDFWLKPQTECQRPL
jgi:alcohol dehydrogenase (NADP+)